MNLVAKFKDVKFIDKRKIDPTSLWCKLCLNNGKDYYISISGSSTSVLVSHFNCKIHKNEAEQFKLKIKPNWKKRRIN